MRLSVIVGASLAVAASAGAAETAQDTYNKKMERCGLSYQQSMERIAAFAVKESRKASDRAGAERMKQMCEMSARQALERANLYEKQHAK